MAALEVAFGFLHVALRVVEALLALHAEALELALQFGEAVAQFLLAIAELRLGPYPPDPGPDRRPGRRRCRPGRRVRTILIRLPLRVLLVGRRLIAPRPLARALLLVAAECIVAQSLLVAKKFLEFADLLAHLAFGRAFLAVLRAAHVLEHLLHLVEHGLGVFARAVARGVLHLVHHLVEILRLKRSDPRDCCRARVARHLAHEAVRGLSQLLHELLDFFVACAALKRFAQSLLGGAQVALGLRGVAILDLLRHRPEQGRDVKQIGVAVGVLERGLGLLEAEIDVGGRVEQFRRDREPGQCRVDPFWRMVRVEDEVATLLDERAGERIMEGALRQRHFDRRRFRRSCPKC